MSIDRKPRIEPRWRDIIKDCQESGQSIRSYCQRRGISEGVFYYWRKKLFSQTESKLHPSQIPTFVPVRLLNPIRFRIKLKCPSEHLVSIAGLDGETLAEVFASLVGEASC